MGIPIACVRACVSWLLVIVIAAAGTGIAQAQSGILDVTGSVTANDGTPIAGASVVLVMQSTSKTARSDAGGRFTIANVVPGTYSFHASAPGYETISQRTVTIDSSKASIDITLSRATTNSLTVIGTVRASAGETVSTASAPSITLNAQNAAAAGVSSAAAMVWPQLSVTPVLPLGGGSNATQTFAVRGPDPTETLVDIDGHQMNNGNTGDFDLSLLDPAALQAVQVVYGIAPSSLIGPNTIGGGINILTLEPTIAPHSLLRFYGGSYGTYGGTVQTTGTDDRFGYALSFHATGSDGSVNQSVLAPPPGGPSSGGGDARPMDSSDETLQSVGSGSWGNSILTKLRYQLGGPTGYGYLQFDFRNQTVTKDESALLTNYTPSGFTGGGDDAVSRGGQIDPFDAATSGGYQSFAGTWLGAHQSNYGFDAQLPLGAQQVNGAPATLLQFSHLTTVATQSISGPGAETQQYLYNQRDALGDDWLELDHHFNNGMLSFKYDLGTENLTTNYVQGEVVAEAQPIGGGFGPTPQGIAPALISPADAPPLQTLGLGQTERSAVLRYNGDPTSHIHYSIAAYESNFSTFGTSFDPRAGFVWTPTSNTAVRASVGTTFQTPQLSELVVPPPGDRVPIGGVIYTGNPDLQPDHATDYDIGMEQIFGKGTHPLHLSMDLYQTNLRSPSSQLNVIPIPHCETKRNPTACPISMPVNAGNGVYRGIDVHADQQLGRDMHLRAGWDVDSSFLTVIPVAIQDGTLAAGEQSLGQPLHKAYLGLEQEPPQGLAYGAELNYEGWYNELNRSPYATLNAHVAYRRDGFEYGIYGTNLTNVYSDPFTLIGGGFVYGGIPGAPVIPTDAYVLQGAQVIFVVTRLI
ncbi:MAG TPA: TonB-dependent receptor [Candidatus Cybelea sp.]|jgi:outer membrane receptor protein involved in Fe transport|nr:TonB-dependent receptor [Candidatus Cybelea sp.]